MAVTRLINKTGLSLLLTAFLGAGTALAQSRTAEPAPDTRRQNKLERKDQRLDRQSDRIEQRNPNGYGRRDERVERRDQRNDRRQVRTDQRVEGRRAARKDSIN